MSVISLLKKTGIHCSHEIRATFHTNPQQDRSESAIAVNPLDTNNLIGVSKLFYDITKYKFTVGAIYSVDAGLTWKESASLELLPGWEGLTDPSVVFDQTGTAYLMTESLIFNYETDPDYDPKIADDIVIKEMVIYKSEDKGATWGKPIIVSKNRDDNPNFDRPWITVDRNSGNLYCAWGAGKLQFARSDNRGRNWNGMGSQSIDNFIADAGLPEINVDSKGNIHLLSLGPLPYISYLRSADKGNSFETEKKIANNLSLALNPLPGATFRLWGGLSACTLNKKVFVGWADNREKVSRIYFTYSNNYGDTWPSDSGLPLLPELTADKFHDFFPQIVATANGVIGCAFYRYYEDSKFIDVMFTASFDGGKSFMPSQKLNDASWNPATNAPWSHGDSNVTFIGDYFGLDADQENFYVLWTNTKDGVQELYFNTVYTTVHTILIPDNRKRPKFEITDIVSNIDVEVLKAIAVDGGGYIIVKGRIIKVPPRGPYDKVVHAIAKILSSGWKEGDDNSRPIRETEKSKI